MAKFRALTDLELRKSSDKDDPLYQEWFSWKAGTIFEAPAHLNTERGVQRGIMEPVEPKQPVARGRHNG